jgi:hypothetical protein
MDADYAANRLDATQPRFEHALFVKTQIISAQHPCRVRRGHRATPLTQSLPKVHAAFQ